MSLLGATRRSTWYVGDDQYLPEVEDIFPSMEGSGQWMGYRWLTSAEGADLDQKVVLDAFARRGGWWPQVHGLALILAVDRLEPMKWRSRAFGDSTGGGLQYLSDAISSASRSSDTNSR